MGQGPSVPPPPYRVKAWGLALWRMRREGPADAHGSGLIGRGGYGRIGGMVDTSDQVTWHTLVFLDGVLMGSVKAAGLEVERGKWSGWVEQWRLDGTVARKTGHVRIMSAGPEAECAWHTGETQAWA